MKKFLIAALALVITATFASAGIGILWTTTYGAYIHNAPNVTDYPSPNNLLGSYSAIWQLIYAGANNAIDSIPLNTVPTVDSGTGFYEVYGDDQVLAERKIAQGGGSGGDGTGWDEWMVWDGTGDNGYVDLSWSNAGFVYQRVFEGTPANQSWYYETPANEMLSLNTGFAGGGAPLQDFSIDTGSAGFQPTHQLTTIPEPATMSLLGLGALIVAMRRRRS